MKRKAAKQNLKKYRSVRQKAVILTVIAAVVLAAPASGFAVRAALENERSEEVRSVHLTDDQIEVSTLVIGSHLIHISALTDELYEVAMQSASDFTQYEMYYKSELSEGKWYEITSAASIEDISTQGKPVDKSVIEALEFTHQTKSDGITYNLREGTAVSMFDINAPYNLEAMPELEPLRLQHQMLREKDEDSQTDSDLVYLDMIGDFFKESIKTEETDKLDNSLRGLFAYKQSLASGSAESAMSDKADEVMGMLDAERRVYSLTKLADLLDVLELHAGGMNTEEEKEKKEQAKMAQEEAGEKRKKKDYDGALKILKEAYEKTQEPFLEQEIKEVKAEKAIYEANNKEGAFKKEVAGWKNELDNIESDIFDLKSEIEDLEIEIGELDDQIQKLDDQMKELDNKIKELDDQIKEADEEKKKELEEKKKESEEEKKESEEKKKELEEKKSKPKEILDGKKNKEKEKEKRQGTLKEKLSDSGLEREQENFFADTVQELKMLYEEVKDPRLYEKIKELGENTEYLPEEETDPAFTVNEQVVSAIAECIKNVEESINSNETKRLSEGSTIVSRAQYEEIGNLRGNAEAGNHSACDSSVDHLIDMDNIVEGKMVHQDRELALLESSLVSRGYEAYKTALSAGAGEDYEKAVADKSSRAVLNRLLEEKQSETNTIRLEYQTLLDARAKRMENSAAQAYLLGLADGIGELENAVAADAAAAFQQQTVSDHLAWLKDEYNNILKEASGSSEMEQMQNEKQNILTAKADALDQNDLAEAKRQDALLEAKQQDIEAKEKELSDILNSPSSSQSEKAKAAGELGSGSSAANMNQLAADLASQIRDGNTNSLQNGMDAIRAMGELDPDAASQALSEVEKAVEEALATDSAALDQEVLKEAKEQANELQDTFAASGGSSGNGGSGSGGMDKEALLSFLEDLLGMGFDSLSAKEQAGVLLAVEWYGEYTLNREIADLAAEYARQMKAENNGYVYDKYKQEALEYVSLRAIGNVFSYRYIFDDTERSVTLTGGKSYYLFEEGKREYEMTEEKQGMLSRPAVFQDTLYINEDSCEKLFSCEAEYIDRETLGLLVTADVKANAENIYEAMLEGGQ